MLYYYSRLGLLRIGPTLYRLRWGAVRGIHFWQHLCATQPRDRVLLPLPARLCWALTLHQHYSVVLECCSSSSGGGRVRFGVLLWRIQRAVRAWVAARRQARAEAFVQALDWLHDDALRMCCRGLLPS
jgi:hypothetical protein